LRQLHLVALVTASAKTNIARLVANGKATGAHTRKTLGKLLIHGFDGGNNTNQRHNTKGNNGHRKSGTKPVAAYGAKGQ